MSDNQFIVNPEHRNIGPLNAHEKHTMRPALYTYGVGALVFLAGILLSSMAPDLFRSLGGWVTVVALVAVAVLVGSFSIIRRMNRRSAMPDESSGPDRD